MYPLIAKWTILPGNEDAAVAALKNLAEEVQKNEQDTLLYMVHTPDFTAQSLPTAPAGEVVFIEIYKDYRAFIAHITGPVFTGFVGSYGHLFLQDFSKPSNVFMLTEILTNIAGFARPGL